MERKFDIMSMVIHLMDEKYSLAQSLLEWSLQINRMKIEEMAKLPFRLNLLETFACGNMRETAHSRFLWNLLQDRNMMRHFMSEFFPDVFDDKNNFKINYPDKNRIDLSIETKSDFFIIENKINDADEMTGQFYRYVNIGLQRYKPENVHVLYLNSKTNDPPSSKSTSKDGAEIEFIPGEVRKSMKVISYKNEIIGWLEKIYDLTYPDEIYIKSALFQYIDYLKEKFKISKRFDIMNKKIEEHIKQKLFTEDMYTCDRMKAISDMQEQLEELKSQLVNLHTKEEENRFHEWYEQLTCDFPLSKYAWQRDKACDIHLDFKYHKNPLSVCLTIDGGLGWGIKSEKNNLPNKWVDEIRKEVKKVLHIDEKTYECWPVWKYTSYEDGLEEFRSLLKCVLRIQDK